MFIVRQMYASEAALREDTARFAWPRLSSHVGEQRPHCRSTFLQSPGSREHLGEPAAHSAEESPLFRSHGARREEEEENGVRHPWEDRRLVMNCSKKREQGFLQKAVRAGHE